MLFPTEIVRIVCRSLTPDILKTLLNAFVSCRLDYCNSPFAGLPAHDIARLQSVQNAAARPFGGISKSENVQPVLRDVIHWLPVGERITFKVALSDIHSTSWTNTILSDRYACSSGKQSSPMSKSVCWSWRLGCASCNEHQLWWPQFFDSCTKAVEQSTAHQRQHIVPI